VLIVERGQQVPPRADGCERIDLPGLFLVRRQSTLVFFVGDAVPTVLLRQGSYSLKPPRVWKPAPTGLVVFGSAGYGRFRDASGIACGSLTDCSGKDSAVLFNAGAAFWLAKFVAAEISYMRPAEAKTTFTGDTFSFDSVLDAEIVNISGKLGVPIGPTRLYGNIGTTYHRALTRTTQKSGSNTDIFDVQTEGWGWMWAAGVETWIASSFALYAEGGSMGLKGKATNTVDGVIDERLNYAAAGIRVRIGK
jgi:opacity protein-like surface antigen